MEKLKFKSDVNEKNIDYDLNELLKEKCDRENANVGDLKYYDCPICKNRGYISFIKDNTIKAKICECKPIRAIYEELARSGISESDLQRYTIDNYEDTKDYQKYIKTKIVEHLKNFDNLPNNKNWVILSAQSGIGKTHILTAEFVELVKKGYSGKYVLWKEMVEKLSTLKKSYNDTQRTKYEQEMDKIKNCDILYIDDYFKQFNDKNKEDYLSFAYDIINSRYINKKCTIISTEYEKDILASVDMAIFGRLYEMASVWLFAKKDPTRNYRLNNTKEF